MSLRSLSMACVFLFGAHLMSAAKPAAAQPQFWFDPLPELPGGASEVFGVQTINGNGEVNYLEFAVGRSLDGDLVNKAVVWTKPAGQPWEIEVLPNPFGNTESLGYTIVVASYNIERFFGGYANTPGGVCVGGSNSGNPCAVNADCPGSACLIAGKGSPQPVVWTCQEFSDPCVWTAEVLPLPPSGVGGSVSSFRNCPLDIDRPCPLGPPNCCGHINLQDGTPNAAVWTRDQANQSWTIQQLPDSGPGFASEARSIVTDPATGLSVVGGHVQPESGFGLLPCVWEEQPGGGFLRTDLLMTPGAYLGSVTDLAFSVTLTPASAKEVSVGFNATVAGLADLYRGVLYRRENGLWGAPLELPPLPGMRDSRATGFVVDYSSSPGHLVVVGHSYIEPSPGSERATLWEVAPDDTITAHDLNDRTPNLPAGVSLAISDDVFNQIFYWVAGTFTNDGDPESTPHANILILLSETDCNANGEDDYIDLYNGTSPDANGNGVPDECEPRFSFEALPELPGGASEPNSFVTEGGPNPQAVVVNVAGRSLDEDGIWKAVAWRKSGNQPWQLDPLPNPFGNTESVALMVDHGDPDFYYFSGGSANTPGGTCVGSVCVGGGNNGNFCTVNADCACLPGSAACSRPVVWTGDGVGPWIVEVLPLTPDGVGGSVSFVGNCLRDCGTCPEPLSVGHINLQDATSKAAVWTRDEANQTWIVEILPDYGPGFSSEAKSAALDRRDAADPCDDLLVIGGQVHNDGGQIVPGVWEEIDGGGFNLVELPLLPGGDTGSCAKVQIQPDDSLMYAVGASSTSVGTEHAVVWRNSAGIWEAPIDLGTLPESANSYSDHVGCRPQPEGFCVVGHSDNGPGTERATLWEINLPQAGEYDVYMYNANDLTANLPVGVTLRALVGTVTMALPLEFTFAGTFTSDSGAVAGPGSTPHAYVLASFPAVPQVDTSGIDKTRFISFMPPGPSANSAIRVTLASLHHVDPPYTAGPSTPVTYFEGQSQYVGPPVQFIESTSSGTPFFASKLQCAPHYQDWSTVGLLHVAGEAIVPSSSYDVQSLAASCMGHEAICAAVSTALPVATARSGDVVAAFQDPTQAASQPDFDDIGALVDKFKSALGAPIKARSKLSGVDARGLIDITPDVGFDDISLDVDAFKGVPYPYMPGKCTGNETKACISNADCVTLGICILCP